MTDSVSQSATKSLSISVADPLSVTTTSLPGGTVGQAYSQSVTATGGKSPYAWSVTAGSLPPGVTLNASTGAVTGTPTSSGTFNFTVQASDSGNPVRTATKALSISVVAQLVVNTTSLPGGTVGQAYSQTLSASGGTPPYAWSLASGSLPPGLNLAASTGVVSGTPTTAGTYSFTAQVTDGAQTATKALSIAVSPASTLSITTASLPQGRVLTGYSATLTAAGGTPPYTWSRIAGALPNGLTLSSSGTISGTPAKPGSYTFTVRVTDSLGAIASKTFTVKINKH